MSDAISRNDDERRRRWRLILGGNAADGTGYELSGGDIGLDQALSSYNFV